MDKNKTPFLLCLLGDVTKDLTHYKEAWQMSEGRSSRAQKSMGDWYFDKKEYSKCIEFYKTSLTINSINPQAWSRLAFAALTTENYEDSAKAYRRLLQFDQDNFEAWNNLSKVYIKLGDKMRAFRTLHEALKCNFEEWRIWENYLLVSLDVGAFEEVINAWHRLIDLKRKHEDDQVLKVLIKAILDDCCDIDGESARKLSVKAQKLLGRISVTVTGSWIFWSLYAKIAIQNSESCDKVFVLFKKSVQQSLRIADWEKDFDLMKDILDNLLTARDYYVHNFEGCEEKLEAQRSFNSIKLSMIEFKKTIDKSREYWESKSDSDTFKVKVEQLDEENFKLISPT